MSNATRTKDPTREARPFVSSKITDQHLRLAAVLYVRQSTSHQLREHQESTARQYQLTDRLIALGWSKDQIIVIGKKRARNGEPPRYQRGMRKLRDLIASPVVDGIQNYTIIMIHVAYLIRGSSTQEKYHAPWSSCSSRRDDLSRSQSR